MTSTQRNKLYSRLREVAVEEGHYAGGALGVLYYGIEDYELGFVNSVGPMLGQWELPILGVTVTKHD